MTLYDWLIDNGHKEKLPKDLVEGTHTGHIFDEMYCYNCKECTDEENDPDPYGTNWKYNQANKDWLEALKQIEAPKEGEQ